MKKINIIDIKKEDEDHDKIIPEWIDEKDQHGFPIWAPVTKSSSTSNFNDDYESRRGLIRSARAWIEQCSDIESVVLKIYKFNSGKFQGWLKYNKKGAS